MLDTIGRRRDANVLAQKASEALVDNAKVEDSKKQDGHGKILRRLNNLLTSTPSYSLASEIARNMRDSRLNLNVVTYNILINKAPDDDETESLVEQMRGEGIAPDVVTYTTLIAKAPDYDEAKGLVEQMSGEGIAPDVVSYNTLIAKAPDYDEAKGLVEQMRGEGIAPNVATYCTVFSKSLGGKSADEIVEWYVAQEYDSEEPIQAAIANLRRSGNIDEALSLSLKYPHLPAAQKVIQRAKDRE